MSQSKPLDMNNQSATPQALHSPNRQPYALQPVENHSPYRAIATWNDDYSDPMSEYSLMMQGNSVDLELVNDFNRVLSFEANVPQLLYNQRSAEQLMNYNSTMNVYNHSLSSYNQAMNFFTNPLIHSYYAGYGAWNVGAYLYEQYVNEETAAIFYNRGLNFGSRCNDLDNIEQPRNIDYHNFDQPAENLPAVEDGRNNVGFTFEEINGDIVTAHTGFSFVLFATDQLYTDMNIATQHRRKVLNLIELLTRPRNAGDLSLIIIQEGVVHYFRTERTFQNSGVQTLNEALGRVKNLMVENGITKMAMPPISSNINWAIIKNRIKKIFNDTDIHMQIYTVDEKPINEDEDELVLADYEEDYPISYIDDDDEGSTTTEEDESGTSGDFEDVSDEDLAIIGEENNKIVDDDIISYEGKYELSDIQEEHLELEIPAKSGGEFPEINNSKIKMLM